jgi:hypothetical protein
VGKIDDGLGIRLGFRAHTLVDRHRQNPSVEADNSTLSMLGVPIAYVIGPKRRVEGPLFVQTAQ